MPSTQQIHDYAVAALKSAATEKDRCYYTGLRILTENQLAHRGHHNRTYQTTNPTR
jgi:hypothetical protein